MENIKRDFEINENDELKNEILRYVNFWPYLLLLTFVAFLIAFTYLRYAKTTINTTSVIEIMDPAQNSEMALPTELTVFNRSMINLENEISRLNSFALNSNVVKAIRANVLYYLVGNIKNSQITAETWYDEYELDFKIDTELVEKQLRFVISTSENNLKISLFDKNNELVNSTKFESLSTLDKSHQLPFELTIISDSNPSTDRELILNSVTNQTNQFRSKLEVRALGKESDQLYLSLEHQNHNIAQNYLNSLTIAFDEDGVSDRRLEYKRTIEFVNKREQILKNELNIIELKKQNYKQENNLTDINIDANNNIDLKYTYNSEIFQLESQKQIAEYLTELIEQSNYEYLPINLGLENFDLNNMIGNYNEIISERYRYINEAGINNFLVKSLEPQLNNLLQNISVSLNNFLGSVDLKLKNLRLKENEFDDEYNRVPENEKTLRAIERELSIKEALYLLLLQKREEASINLAVVKPTIKVIDYAITDFSSRKPNSRIIYLFSIILSFLVYFSVLYIRFFMDNKVHNKDQLVKLIDKNIPIIAEIPFVDNIELETLRGDSSARSAISESIRMLLSNLRFTSLDKQNPQKNNLQTIIFTSSIKGEGKTLASVNTALSLANDLNRNKKTILLGTDLRNPQIHKRFGVEKTQTGISEIIYSGDQKNYKNYIKSYENLDILYSGTIPPNPTALLSSDSFKDLLSLLKSDYDYIIIDSAPCLLVSDTFQFLSYADAVVYLFRSNFTDSKIVEFINEMYIDKKIKNINIVFNAVGNSKSYGYKYGYQYGYKYGYKYAYNYGYGYGYGNDNDKKEA